MHGGAGGRGTGPKTEASPSNLTFTDVQVFDTYMREITYTLYLYSCVSNMDYASVTVILYISLIAITFGWSRLSVLSTIVKFEEDGEWIDANFDKIQERYRNRFIAVKNRTIIIDAEKLESIIDELKSKGVGLDDVLIQFVHGKDFSFLL